MTTYPADTRNTSIADAPQHYIDLCRAIAASIKAATTRRFKVTGNYTPGGVDDFGNHLSDCVTFQLRTQSGKHLTDLAWTTEYLLESNDTPESLIDDAMKAARRYF